MKIVAHRGVWSTSVPGNSLAAHLGALKKGWGTEVDVRDRDGLLVIAHDPGEKGAPLFEDLLAAAPARSLFAVNVKAAGLLPEIAGALERHGHRGFVFDLPPPEFPVARRLALPAYGRLSPFETRLQFADAVGGVVLDSFGDAGFWRGLSSLRTEAAGKPVFVISDEIHGLDPLPQWVLLKESAGADDALCTDRPDEAAEFFE